MTHGGVDRGDFHFDRWLDNQPGMPVLSGTAASHFNNRARGVPASASRYENSVGNELDDTGNIKFKRHKHNKFKQDRSVVEAAVG
ncbi:hypothetical protein [Gimesia alba]|uniref:hypothetical protein n=1 Tax=Gimesia alba TaxID=2527973 RepID=UPI0018D621EB|nr:hypothetical protein [Gimesia alba]